MFENIKDTISNLTDNEKVQETVEKAKAFINTDEGREKIEEIKDKVEDFVSDKTNGNGIFGFGKKYPTVLKPPGKGPDQPSIDPGL